MIEASQRAYAWILTGLILFLSGILGTGFPYFMLIGAFMLLTAYASYRRAETYEAVLEALRATRSLERRLVYEGSEVAVRLEARDYSGLGAPVFRIMDSIPPRTRLGRGSSYVEASLSPGGVVETEYTVKPFPGLHEFGEVRVEVGDILGLFHASRRMEFRDYLRTIPAHSPPRGLSSLSALPWFGATSRRMARGRGLELYELRDYVLGDDPRRIVWTAVARTGRLIVREDLHETRAKIILVIDLSRESWVGAPGDTAADHIARASLSIARHAALMGDLLGFILVTGSSMITVYPGRGSEVYRLLSDRLSMFSPDTVKPRRVLGRAIEDATILARGGVVIVHSGPGALREVSGKLYELRGRRVIVLHHVPGGEDPVSRLVRMLEEDQLRGINDPQGIARRRVLIVPGWGWVRMVPKILAEVGRPA